MSACKLTEAKVVNSLRLDLGLTMRDLCIILGLSKSSKLISKIEKGTKGIPADLLYKFSIALKVPIKVLVDLKVEEYRDKLEGEVYETIQASR